MILLEEVSITGFEDAIRGMRNPMNSWNKSDSGRCMDNCLEKGPCDSNCMDCSKFEYGQFCVGTNDLELMLKLAKAGSVHAKFRRMITVYMDVTAPLYWWKEFDTYKVGTVANSCSTMHKIHAKEFAIDDFSHEHLISDWVDGNVEAFVFEKFNAPYSPKEVLGVAINALNACRNAFLNTNDKRFWWQMIQLLPSSYNQKRTLMLNYEVLANIYQHRRDHKLDEWRDFCEMIEELPWSEIITCNYQQDLYKYKAHSEMISSLNSCNNCSKHKDCHMAPKLGQPCRVNCFHWMG